MLTFDDGPGEKLTPAVLDILRNADVKATFFLSGFRIRGNEDIVRRIAREGHQICSHGMEHLNHWKVSPLKAVKDIKNGWTAINNALGKNGSVYPFRPPYGKLNLATLIYLLARKVPICFWTVVSGDTWPEQKRSSDRASRLVKQASGGVVLMHDFDREDESVHVMVLDAVRQVFAAADENRIGFKTISQL